MSRWHVHEVRGAGAFELLNEEGELVATLSDCDASTADAIARAHNVRLSDRWAVDLEERGEHVQATVRVGTPGSRALAGRLMLRREEADELHYSLGPDVLVTRTKPGLL